ncbi:hypothetical protein ACFL2I_03555 [Candidatus Omnitrophota bacterium]
MKAIANVALILGVVSLVIGLISRLTTAPVGPMQIEAQAFLQFTNTCLLLAIALGVLELVKK